MQKAMKKCFILILCILTISSIFSCSFAISDTEVTSTFKGSKNADATKVSKSILEDVISVIRIVAAAIAIVILVIIACKYILASAGDRADIKKYAVNYIIGAIILFGASGILSVIKKFIDGAL